MKIIVMNKNIIPAYLIYDQWDLGEDCKLVEEVYDFDLVGTPAVVERFAYNSVLNSHQVVSKLAHPLPEDFRIVCPQQLDEFKQGLKEINTPYAHMDHTLYYCLK